MAKYSNQAKSSSVFIIFGEALIFLIKNWKPVLIFSLLYLIISLLSIFKSLSIIPLFTNLLQNFASLSKLKPPNPDFYQIITVILTELREITIIETIFYVTNFFISSLLQTSTLCFIFLAYTDNKQPTLKELFSKLRKTWKGFMITGFYVTIFSFMGVLLMFLLICGFTLVTMNSAGFHVVRFILLILAVILYLHLAILWSLSLVVSVEEEGIYGLAAIVKGTEILKGRRWKGILIAFFMILLGMVCLFPLMHLSSSGMKKMVISGIFLVVAAVLTVFDLAVVFLFYNECKKRDGGLVMMMNKCGIGYSSLPSEAPVDSEIP